MSKMMICPNTNSRTCPYTYCLHKTPHVKESGCKVDILTDCPACTELKEVSDAKQWRRRRKLACVICALKSGCDYAHEASISQGACTDAVRAADRVIKAGWKSPLDCNTCIDESAQRVSKLMQSQGHSG